MELDMKERESKLSQLDTPLPETPLLLSLLRLSAKALFTSLIFQLAWSSREDSGPRMNSEPVITEAHNPLQLSDTKSMMPTLGEAVGKLEHITPVNWKILETYLKKINR